MLHTKRGHTVRKPTKHPKLGYTRPKHVSHTVKRMSTTTQDVTLTKHRNQGVDYEFALPPTPHPNYKVVIGLETHAQILSNSKMFSDASTEFKAAPNTSTTLFDAALPGTLPRVNQHCVEQAIKTGLALGGKVNLASNFHRKQYFYYDMPTGYQITQVNPIIVGGSLSLDSLLPSGTSSTVGIQHIQLEHDSGKSLHDVSSYQTHIDLNRAGVGLMEIVTTPTIYSAHEAVVYLKKLQGLLRHLGVSTANLEEGSMRCDVNVTVQRINPPGPMTQRVEIKNMNSFKHILYAIQSEAMRQITILENNDDSNDIKGVIERETRGYDHKTDSTYRLRSKEDLLDYRFIPEPDLPILRLNTSYIHNISSNLPVLPDDIYKYTTHVLNLGQKDAHVLINEEGSFDFLMKALTIPTSLSPSITSSSSSEHIQSIPSIYKYVNKPTYDIDANTTINNRYTSISDNISYNINDISSLPLSHYKLYRSPKSVFNILTNDIFGRIKRNRERSPTEGTTRYDALLSNCPIIPLHIAQICDLVSNDHITGKQSKVLVDVLFDTIKESSINNTNINDILSSLDIIQYAKDNGMMMDNNPERIDSLIQLIIKTYPDEVDAYVTQGRKNQFGFLCGQVIKLSKQQKGQGEANPKEVARILQEKLTSM